jgi:hypothetical protein
LQHQLFCLVLKKSSYAKHALAYQINWEIYTPQAGGSGMLLHRKGKLTIAKSKSSRLSYSEVVSLPLESIFSKISSYEADLSVSVVSFISNSSGYQVNIIVKIMVVD